MNILAVPPKGTAFFMHSSQASFLEYLRAERRSSVHTLTAYRTDLDQFAAYLGFTYGIEDLAEVQTLHVRSWLASLRESGVSARSIQRKRSGLSTFYKYLRREGKVEKDPVIRTRSPKSEKRLPVFADQSSMDRMIEGMAWTDDFRGKRDRLMLTLLYESGIRLSELIGLKTSDVDLEKKVFRVLGKRNKERVLPLLEKTIEQLGSYIQERGKAYGHEVPELLLTDSGSKLYPKFVYRKVNSYLGRVSTLDKRSPHVLRHTFATHMLNNGAQLNTVKELLGHASLAATQVYTHNTIEKLKRVHSDNHPKG